MSPRTVQHRLSEADLAWREEVGEQGPRERALARSGPGLTLDTGDVHDLFVWPSGAWEIRGGAYYAVPAACGREASSALAKIRVVRVLKALVEKIR